MARDRGTGQFVEEVPARPDVFAADGSLSPEKIERIMREIRDWPDEQKIAMMAWLEEAAARVRIRKRYANAAELAHSVDPDFVVTPALALIADAIESVLSGPRRNLLVTMSPQEGKSSLCAIWTPIRAWQLNPDRRIILATYGDALAEEHSATCRALIDSHGTGVTDPVTGALVEDKIGLKLSARSRRVSTWKIDGAKGGLVAVGLGSAITGRSADLFIIDDPYKNMIEADSATHRRKVDEWMSSVVLTRLSPQASIILVQTRWHPEDLAGKTLAGDMMLPAHQRTWRHINIPAIAEEGLPDALNRPPGEVMVSARGRTREEFLNTRRQVGERTWYALYQGSPRNPAGGLFSRSWFDPPAAVPANPVAAVVGIDPADSGEGDETGILGAVLDRDGTVVFTEDVSGLYTSDQWATKAVELALRMGAREVAMEGFATFTTYAAVVRRAYADIHRRAREELAAGRTLSVTYQRALAPATPFQITKWTAGGDAVGRAAGLRQAFETRRAKVVDYTLGVFVEQAADWQAGQHCPDRVAAAVIAHDRLAKLGSGYTSIATPLNTGGRDAPEWLTRRISDGRRDQPFSLR